MENTGLQYENSLTRQAEEAMDMWTKELADMSEELMNDPMAVVRSRIFDEKADTGLFSGASGWCFRRNRGIL